MKHVHFVIIITTRVEALLVRQCLDSRLMNRRTYATLPNDDARCATKHCTATDICM